MDQRHRDLVKMGDGLFSGRQSLLNLWQETAEHFYPQRADFTTTRELGYNWAENLFSSYPTAASRELSNLIATMLRPRGTEWFALHAKDERIDEDEDARRELERRTRIQRKAMYDPMAALVRATKEADRDFANFGQAVIEVSENPLVPGLLHTTHHLRDCAWAENVAGQVDVMHRKWMPTARDLKDKFENTDKGVHRNVVNLCKEDPFRKVTCRHIVVPSRLYDYEDKNGRKFPFVSLYIDCENEHLLEEVPRNWFGYVVPRWATISGSQYAYSLATDLVLPDARTVQSVVRALLEAGEKYVDPPMIAVGEAIRSDMALYAGGVTWVDEAYDEKLGEVLRPLSQDKGGMPIGFEIAAGLREDIRHGFFLDRIQLPAFDANMTAYEVKRRLEEHVRAAAPLFEPIEQEYSQPLCEVDYAILDANGTFGDVRQVPQALQGADVEYRFESPLQDMEDRGKAAMFAEGLNLIGQVAEADPSQIEHANLDEGTRDSLRGIGWPEDWINRMDDVLARRQQAAEQAQAQQAMEAMAQVAA